MDTNVTRRSHSSSKAEQRPVESGIEEIGSSLQRIASGMLSVEVASGNINTQGVIHTNFEEGRDDMVPGDFEDLMEMVVLKKDFKNSMDTISQRLKQIPLELDGPGKLRTQFNLSHGNQ